MPLMDEMRAELRNLKKEAGGNSISKMKKADLERQIEVYRGMVSSKADSPLPARRAEKSAPVSRREPEAAPKKRVGESAPSGGGKPRIISKAPKVREDADDATVSKHTPKAAKKPTVETKAPKAAKAVPKKMTVPSPEESGSEFDE